MPIYEYNCRGCRQRASIFFRSFSATETNPACPHCGERRLERRVSRVWSRRSSGEDDGFPQPTFEDDGVPFYGPNPYDDPYGFGDDPSFDGEYGDSGDDSGTGEDLAAMAREARAMAQMMGEPLDAEFDEALRHVERGADPDEVFGELDAAESKRETPTTDGDP